MVHWNIIIGIDGLITFDQYLLNTAEIDGKIVGIPYSYWQSHNANK